MWMRLSLEPVREGSGVCRSVASGLPTVLSAASFGARVTTVHGLAVGFHGSLQQGVTRQAPCEVLCLALPCHARANTLRWCSEP